MLARQIEGFAASLDRAFGGAVDPGARVVSSRARRGRLSESPATAMSEDVFLYARCAVVAHCRAELVEILVTGGMSREEAIRSLGRATS